MLKVGSIVYATKQGLGYLAKDFFDNDIITHPFILGHSSRQSFHREWYGNIYPHCSVKDPSWRGLARNWLKKCDVVLFFETPFDWTLLNQLKRTVLMPMYECMPSVWPAQPAAILNPSLLDQQLYPKGKYIPVPVNPPVYPVIRSSFATTFVFNGGNGGLHGRNGTKEMIEAVKLCKSGAKFILSQQEDSGLGHYNFRTHNPNVKFRNAQDSRDTLYAEGEVLVCPEKFNGLSLPLQEGVAAGMVPLVTKRFPQTQTFRDCARFIWVSHVEHDKIGAGGLQFESSVIDPQDLANVIDSMYGTDISEEQDACYEWAKAHSWTALKPKYLEFLESVV